WIDPYEVTIGEYRQFVTAQGAERPNTWDGSTANAPDEHPVTGVRFEWADAFCRSLGKRLPSEVEYEVVARGPKGYKYPWGDQAPNQPPVKGQRPAPTLPRETYAARDEKYAGNVSDLGVHGLYGTVWQWVDPPTNPVRQGLRMLRGPAAGYFGTTGTRLWFDPARSRSFAGFRCAAEPNATVLAVGDFGQAPAPVLGAETVEQPLAPGVLVDVDFTDPTQMGFRGRGEQGVGYAGWHPEPAELGEARAASFHLHVNKGAKKPVISLYGGQYGPTEKLRVEIKASRFRELETPRDDTNVGEFWYGLVVRAAVASGPPADPSSYLAFLVNPASGEWRVTVRSSDRGSIDLARSTQTIPPQVTLGVDMDGDQFIFRLGASTVTRLAVPGLSGGGVGIYLENDPGSDEKHVHFERFRVCNPDATACRS
ncbi:MAG: formylglycine-generating enzyme family protein, partial [Acidimicrobiales bacterium]